jgi:tRNA G46 methylase TrmB
VVKTQKQLGFQFSFNCPQLKLQIPQSPPSQSAQLSPQFNPDSHHKHSKFTHRIKGHEMASETERQLEKNCEMAIYTDNELTD